MLRSLRSLQNSASHQARSWQNDACRRIQVPTFGLVSKRLDHQLDANGVRARWPYIRHRADLADTKTDHYKNMCPHSGAQGHARAQQPEEFFWDGSPQRNTVNGVHLKWISAALTRSNRYALPDKTRKVQPALTNTTPGGFQPFSSCCYTCRVRSCNRGLQAS